jgi:hypothetical protein
MMAGAAAVRWNPKAWENVGILIGEALELATNAEKFTVQPCEPRTTTIPTTYRTRPSESNVRYMAAPRHDFDSLIEEATRWIPDCPGAGQLRNEIGVLSREFANFHNNPGQSVGEAARNPSMREVSHLRIC